jgi:hypothetical protein
MNLREEKKMPEIDIKNRVMEKIQAEDIKMTSPLVFLAEKVGLESVLALCIIVGAIAVSSVFYVLKKNGELQFLSSDLPTSAKRIVLLLPYDYIALFLITVLLGAYLVKRLFCFRGAPCPKRISVVILFFIAFAIGLIFAYMGIGQFESSFASVSKINRGMILK